LAQFQYRFVRLIIIKYLSDNYKHLCFNKWINAMHYGEVKKCGQK